MDVPYLIHVPDGDELWLVDGERRLLITPRIYDLLASNGADLPPAYGIEELREQNAKLRELVEDMFGGYRGAVEMLPSSYSKNVAEMAVMDISDRMRELGVEVDG